MNQVVDEDLLREILGEDYEPSKDVAETLPDGSLVVGPDHPAWRSIDDDDWNGATFANWLRALGGHAVVLRPGGVHPKELVERMRETISRCAKSCRVDA